MFPSNWFIRPHFRNLFKMVFKSKAVKLTHFEKSPKNTFLVNAKKWKKWEKWSSKWNHQKVALTNCHYFVNSDPHAKIEEVLTRRFVERESFQQKGTCIIFIVLLHGRGPYPSLIAFFATRDHLAQSGTSGLIFVFSFFWNQKRVSSSNDIIWSSKYVDFYAFPFAMRPSGANANAQLILPGENFSEKNSDKL